jgi:hypothetical protein
MLATTTSNSIKVKALACARPFMFIEIISGNHPSLKERKLIGYNAPFPPVRVFRLFRGSTHPGKTKSTPDRCTIRRRSFVKCRHPMTAACARMKKSGNPAESILPCRTAEMSAAPAMLTQNPIPSDKTISLQTTYRLL